MRQNKGFLELRRLEAAREIANILAASGNRVMLDSQGLLLNGMSISASLTTSIFMSPSVHTVTDSKAQEILKTSR